MAPWQEQLRLWPVDDPVPLAVGRELRRLHPGVWFGDWSAAVDVDGPTLHEVLG